MAKRGRQDSRRKWKNLRGGDDETGNSEGNNPKKRRYEHRPLPPGMTEKDRSVVPKKKYAIVFGYLGTGFHGMQKQIGDPDLRTIEGVLENAIRECGGLTSGQEIDPAKMQWSRVGRTDKGVHAACQVVTLKMSLGPISEEEKMTYAECDRVLGGSAQRDQAEEDDQLLSARSTAANSLLDEEVQTAKDAVRSKLQEIQRNREINFAKRLQAALSSEFRVYDVIRVPGFFDARLRAHQRHYEFCLPAHVLRPMILSDNSGIMRDFFLEFLPQIPVDEIQSKIVPFEVKQRVFGAIADKEVDCSNLMEGPMANDILRWREETAFLRRSYALLDGVTRLKIWERFGKDEPRQEGFVPPYAPTALLAMKQKLLTAEEQAKYELTDQEITRFQSILSCYEGNHHWFNFTSRLSSNDPSGTRNIESVKVHKWLSDEKEGQLLIIRLIGQSFLLNQIRKMISVAIESYVGSCPHSTASWLYTLPLTPKKHIHLAPGEGLLLERAIFDAYNKERKRIMPRLVLQDPDRESGAEMEKPPEEEVTSSAKTHQQRQGTVAPMAVNSSPSSYSSSTTNTTVAACDTVSIESAAPVSSGLVVEEWLKEDYATRPSWWKILEFKRTVVYPWIITVFNSNPVWHRYVADISWHPFLTENFPTPVENGCMPSRTEGNAEPVSEDAAEGNDPLACEEHEEDAGSAATKNSQDATTAESSMSLARFREGESRVLLDPNSTENLPISTGPTIEL